MGQIAEDMLDGTTCSECGGFFIDPKKPDTHCYTHGYPVLCRECFDGKYNMSKVKDRNRAQQRGHVRAIVGSL